MAATRRGDFGHAGKLPVNLSGGAISFNPVFCTGLLRIVEAANQVRGCAGIHQRANVRRALAHGASGFAMQYNNVVVFGSAPLKAAKKAAPKSAQKPAQKQTKPAAKRVASRPARKVIAKTKVAQKPVRKATVKTKQTLNQRSKK